MIVQMDRQDVISNNLANVDNTGFKKDQAVIKEYPGFELYRKDDEREIIPGGIESKLTPVGKLGTGAQLQDVATDFTQGAILETGNKTDFAILGDGFFAVDTANGVKLTRDGSFYIDKNRVHVLKFLPREHKEFTFVIKSLSAKLYVFNFLVEIILIVYHFCLNFYEKSRASLKLSTIIPGHSTPARSTQIYKKNKRLKTSVVFAEVCNA